MGIAPSSLGRRYGGAGFTTAEVVSDLAPGTSPVLDALPDELSETWHDAEKRTGFNKRLGKALSSRCDRRYGADQHRLERLRKERSAQVWRVVSVSPDAAG